MTILIEEQQLNPYFVTANVLQKKSLFQVEKIARLFIEVMLQYRAEKKYLLHEFVVMP